MSEPSLSVREEIRKGKRAQAIMGDPLVMQAFAELEQEYFAAFKAAKLDDLVLLQAKTKVIDDVKTSLSVLIERGEQHEAAVQRDRA